MGLSEQNNLLEVILEKVTNKETSKGTKKTVECSRYTRGLLHFIHHHLNTKTPNLWQNVNY